MTSALKIYNFDLLDLELISYILKDYNHEILPEHIQYEANHILITYRNPEELRELEWAKLGQNTETSVMKPHQRNNLHKGVPTYITPESYQKQHAKTATLARRLTTDGHPIPSLELTYRTALDQLDDLKTITKLGKNIITKQISTSTGHVICTNCLILRPPRQHLHCNPICSYCAQKGHTKPDCSHKNDTEHANRLCALCGDDHEALRCTTYTQVKREILHRRQQRALRQLEHDATAEQKDKELAVEQKSSEQTSNKRKRMEPLEVTKEHPDRCPHCLKTFPIEILPKHITRCINNQGKETTQIKLSFYKNER
jgi:hypothetical protein